MMTGAKGTMREREDGLGGCKSCGGPLCVSGGKVVCVSCATPHDERTGELAQESLPGPRAEPARSRPLAQASLENAYNDRVAELTRRLDALDRRVHALEASRAAARKAV
jgi:uncharacterized Zn finger protein (UPF0148 family)